MLSARFSCTAVALLVTLPAGSGAASEAANNSQGLIAFASVRASGSFELYTMSADGSRQRRLTSNRPRTAWPAWSPDGATLAYVNSALDELWVMRADGTHHRRVTGGVRVDPGSRPSWSPDGGRLVVAGRRMRRPGLWIVTRQTRRVRQLTTGFSDSEPAWSPSGRLIVFTRSNDLYAIAPEAGKPTRLTGTRGIDETTPSWSRGGRLAFAANRGERTDLFVMNANGSGRRAVTTTPDISEFYPDWSPDGTKLLFVDLAEDRRLFIVNVDGTNKRGFEVPIAPYSPDWSPDGSRIVFSDSFSTTGSLDLPSGRARVLTAGRIDSSPAWSRDGQQLAFSRDGVLHVLHLRDRRIRPLVRGSDPSWSPGGRRIAVENSETEGIDIVRADGSGARQSILVDEGIGDTDKREPAWSPEGARIAYTDSNDNFDSKQVCILRLPRPRTSRCFGEGSAPSWSPNGRMLVYRCGRGICTMQADGRRRRTLASLGGGPKFSPDGRQIVYALPVGHTAAIYVMNTVGREKRRLTSSQGLSLAPDWQPLGR